MEASYLLPTTQGESCLLWASAAPSAECEWVRLLVFKLSPQLPRGPRDMAQGQSGRSLELHPHNTRMLLSSVILQSILELLPPKKGLLSPAPLIALSLGPTHWVQLLAPSLLPPSAWGHRGHLHTTMATELPEAIYCTCLPG